MRHNDRKILIKELDDVRLHADMELRDKLEKSPTRQQLLKIAMTFCSFKPFTGAFNNVYDVGKLHITKKKLGEFLDIFISDLGDDLKKHVIFSGILTDPVHDYFNFIERDGENIKVEPLSIKWGTRA
jgi:hypothetical protein